jgi:hypothetical protein
VDGLSAIQFGNAQVGAIGLPSIQSQQTRSHPAMDAAASTLGMTASDLRTALQSGQSLATIASSKGISQATLTAAMTAGIEAANPTISAAQAASVASAMATRTPMVRTGQSGAAGAIGDVSAPGAASVSGTGATHGHHHHHHHGGENAMSAASTLLGMSTSDLTAALQSGQSLASIASSKSVSQSALISALASALQGSGSNLTSDQATQIATQMATHVSGTQSRPGSATPQQAAATAWSAGTPTAASTFTIAA